MCADGGRAVGVGAAQRKFHPGSHIIAVQFSARSAPVEDKAPGGSIRVLFARPDVALVDMGVNIGKARPDHTFERSDDVISPGRPPVT